MHRLYAIEIQLKKFNPLDFNLDLIQPGCLMELTI
jgi:hypothetical protein